MASPSAPRHRKWLRLLAATAGVWFAGCLSPTLPLPPPEAPNYVAPGDEVGVWRIGGNHTPGATVFVQNERTGAIVGREDPNGTGTYLLALEAERCDTGSVFEVVGTHVSDATYFLVQETVAGVPQDPPCDAPP